MRIEIPEFALVVLIGATSSGKTSFAKKHFLPTEVLSSDAFRAMLSDDENDQSISSDAFAALFYMAGKRLEHMRLTVMDATHVQAPGRKRAIALAKAHDCHCVAIVLNMPEALCRARNHANPARQYPDRVIHQHCGDLRRSLSKLKKEGFRYVYVLNSPEEAEAAEIVRTPLWNNLRQEHGPFDIIGDVHGCYDELVTLLDRLGYVADENGTPMHPLGRKAVFLGDLCDRGPRNVDVLRLVMRMTQSHAALCIPGNHDVKLLNALRGKRVNVDEGLALTLAELEGVEQDFRDAVINFLDGLISHYVLDDGRLVVAHAGLKEAYQGRGSMRVRTFCLYGDVTGAIDDDGLPVRGDWAADYRGKAAVVYGHTPHPAPYIRNNTYCIDTGCVFGGVLTALRYPEMSIVSVEAARMYAQPVRPLVPEKSDADGMLLLEDVSGNMHLQTGLIPQITVREEYTAAALEVMSRFATDPRWLIYLPPTMSPCETSALPEYLEHPAEALRYYQSRGVSRVLCEKKHMGSRAVIVLCKTPEAAQRVFGVPGDETGVIYTRTGRRFFQQPAIEREILERLHASLTQTGFWDAFNTEWVCLDAELMPWSAKAQELLQKQYASVGRAAQNGIRASIDALEAACARPYAVPQADPARYVSGQTLDLADVLARFHLRADAMDAYIDAYRAYCWPVQSVDDLRIAPFHLLAAEGAVFSGKDHPWHLAQINKHCVGTDPLFMATEHILVDLDKEDGVQLVTDWWLALTASGGEGMVIKPYSFIERNGRELLQPAIKCRGREYLRIIYGGEYTLQNNIANLKRRSLTRKRTLALREFALGLEALERFVHRQPLHKVHECVFAVLALESEPVDPRL